MSPPPRRPIDLSPRLLRLRDEPRAYNPMQRRDERGRWTDFGIFGEMDFILGMTHTFDSGDHFEMVAGGDGLQLGFKAEDGTVARSGPLDHAAAIELWDIIDRTARYDTQHAAEEGAEDAEPESGKLVTHRVYSYPKDENGDVDPHAKPDGYIELSTRDNGVTFDVELLDSDHKFQVSGGELLDEALQRDIYRYGTAKRMMGTFGRLDTYISADEDFGFRMYNEDEKLTQVEFDIKSWRSISDAVDLLLDGGDEVLDLTEKKELRVKTNVGMVSVYRHGTVDKWNLIRIMPVDEEKYDWSIWASEDDFLGPSDRDVLSQFGLMEETARNLGIYDVDDGYDPRKRITLARLNMLAKKGRRMARNTRRRAMASAGRSWYNITKPVNETNVAEVYIYDEIGFWGVNASDFVGELNALAAGSLTLRINSPGGEIFDGVTIYNALIRWSQERSAPVNVVVDGLAASAASFIAMAGDKITMLPSSMMMIHEGQGVCIGPASDMRALADLLDKLSANIAAIYATRGTGDAQAWRAAMLAETWYSAEEAVAAGLADEVAPARPDAAAGRGEGSKAAANVALGSDFDLSIFKYAGRNEAPTPFMPEKDQRTPGSVRPEPVPDAFALLASGFLSAASAPAARLTPSVQDLLDALREGQ